MFVRVRSSVRGGVRETRTLWQNGNSKISRVPFNPRLAFLDLYDSNFLKPTTGPQSLNPNQNFNFRLRYLPLASYEVTDWFGFLSGTVETVVSVWLAVCCWLISDMYCGYECGTIVGRKFTAWLTALPNSWTGFGGVKLGVGARSNSDFSGTTQSILSTFSSSE